MLMLKHHLRSLLLALTASVVALLPPATAGAAGKASPRTPTITGVAPLNLGVGDVLTIRGRNFRAGRNRNTVVFKRDGRRAVFVKAAEATSTRIRVTVPEKLNAFLGVRSGQPQPTRFRLRILARRFGRTYSATRHSPRIGPAGQAVTPGSPADTAAEARYAAEDCDQDGQANAADTDDDNDLLSDALETSLRLNACAADTDGDTLEDGWEYESAIDLNLRALPYPGKRPWPNPLDGQDTNVDYDGDDLYAWQEHALWKTYGQTLPLLYSDGTQQSGGVVHTPTDPRYSHLDLDRDGILTDDERDGDGDRLSNWVEAGGPLGQAWWTKTWDKEKPYELTYANVDFSDPDTDGDGILDGDDDEDHDDYDNVYESDGQRRSGVWVQPFNPCLPNPWSRSCSWRAINAEEIWPPFDRGWGQPQPTAPLRWPFQAASGG